MDRMSQTTVMHSGGRMGAAKKGGHLGGTLQR